MGRRKLENLLLELEEPVHLRDSACSVKFNPKISPRVHAKIEDTCKRARLALKAMKG
jgi:hypothetical protein